MSAGLINADAVNADLDAIIADLLALLVRAKDLGDDAVAALTDEARAAGLIVAGQPAVPPVPPTLDEQGRVATDEQGNAINPGSPGKEAGWLGPVTDEQWAALRARLALHGALVNLLDKPLGDAAQSYAERLRAGGRRWRAQ